ncbi:hypothetical protein CYY_000443 [Polysphondylium violaceum]|uniref:RNA polymerase II subunit B1 CTD phosphatase RPAP2 homolog n=1 Tax=Polysphondylium violaceum TaxID=133409 RepID=A0A8J4V5K9_9MYCE|nr:hypothetical protein CYY_000443 [Polysphondylium violaceum]
MNKEMNSTVVPKPKVRQQQQQTHHQSQNNPNVQKKADVLKRSLEKKAAVEKEIFEAQLYLLENQTTAIELKEHWYHLLQPNHYQDIVNERSYAEKCGYPICPNPLPLNKFNQKYLISIKQQKVYNVEELSMFCSEHCLIESKLYQSTLDETPVYLRESKTKPAASTGLQGKDIPMGVLNSFEKSLKITENENASLVPPSKEYNNITKLNDSVPSTTIAATVTTTDTILATAVSNINLNQDVEMNTPPPIKKKESSNNSNQKQQEQKSTKQIEINQYQDNSSIREDELDSDLEDLDNELKVEEEINSHDIEIDDQEDDDEDDDDDDEEEEDFDITNYIVPRSTGFEKSFVPSNYHMIYSALSQFYTKHTSVYLQSSVTPPYEYILDQNFQIKSALHFHLSNVYDSVLSELKFTISVKDNLSNIVDTFNLSKSIPSLNRVHWKMIILIFIKSLSHAHENIKQQYLTNTPLFDKMLIQECGFDHATLKVFEDLLLIGYD